MSRDEHMFLGDETQETLLCQHEQCPYRLRTASPYALHADLVGARNIAMRTLLTRQDWVRTGVLSVRPDISDAKTKAARLKRYAELRWSSDTNSSLGVE